MVPRVAAGGDGGFDDVLGGREIRLAGAEPDDGFAFRLQGLRLGVHGEGGGFGDRGQTTGDTCFGLTGHGHASFGTVTNW
jgi:hypothetical protein